MSIGLGTTAAASMGEGMRLDLTAAKSVVSRVIVLFSRQSVLRQKDGEWMRRLNAGFSRLGRWGGEPGSPAMRSAAVWRDRLVDQARRIWGFLPRFSFSWSWLSARMAWMANQARPLGDAMGEVAASATRSRPFVLATRVSGGQWAAGLVAVMVSVAAADLACGSSGIPAGDAQSRFDHALSYLDGNGVDRDPRRAAMWFEKAAHQDHVRAQEFLAWMYYEGIGVAQDDRRAVHWYHKAAAKGSAPAAQNLGWHYLYGRGIDSDAETAAHWYGVAAEKGRAFAQSMLGQLHLQGLGVPRDDKRAVHWLAKAARAGDTDGRLILGRLYMEGRGVLRNDRRAFTLFRGVAETGDYRGFVHLGWMYLQGRGVERDPATAFAWYRRAAEHGAVDAQLNVAWFYETGTGVAADPAVAHAWLRRAATSTESARTVH